MFPTAGYGLGGCATCPPSLWDARPFLAVPGHGYCPINCHPVPCWARMEFEAVHLSVSSQAEFLPLLGISAAGNYTKTLMASARLQAGRRHGCHPSGPREAACVWPVCAMDRDGSSGCRAACLLCLAPASVLCLYLWQMPHEPSPAGLPAIAGNERCSAIPSMRSAPCRIRLSQRWQLHPQRVHLPAALAGTTAGG